MKDLSLLVSSNTIQSLYSGGFNDLIHEADSTRFLNSANIQRHNKWEKITRLFDKSKALLNKDVFFAKVSEFSAS